MDSTHGFKALRTSLSCVLGALLKRKTGGRHELVPVRVLQADQGQMDVSGRLRSELHFPRSLPSFRAVQEASDRSVWRNLLHKQRRLLRRILQAPRCRRTFHAESEALRTGFRRNPDSVPMIAVRRQLTWPDPTLPSQRKKPRVYRTRANPFEGIWEAEIVPLVQSMPSLQAITILRELQRRHPGRFPDSQLRTLQRHMRRWSALAGPDRDVIFRQVHPPGAQGLSDFTDAGELCVTMAGLVFPHRF
jgi:hypothetical protein